MKGSKRPLLSVVPAALAFLLTFLAAVVEAQEVRSYFVTDPQGSPVIATDAYGNVAWSEDYLPYGERRYRSASSGDNERWFTGAVQNEDTGLVDLGVRKYDPAIGRFLSIDPVGASGEKPFSVNRYAYANNNPYKFVDPDGKEAVVLYGRIYINPENHDIPKMNLPNNVGATGVSTSSWAFHTYDVTTLTQIHDAKSIGEAIRKNPTPGDDSPASPTGTVNNAGYIPTAGDKNFVMSYLVPTPDASRYTDITVNYTIASAHGLHEGFVIRYGEIESDGSILLRSYGEGNAIRQAPIFIPIWRPQVEGVWKRNHQEVTSAIK